MSARTPSRQPRWGYVAAGLALGAAGGLLTSPVEDLLVTAGSGGVLAPLAPFTVAGTAVAGVGVGAVGLGLLGYGLAPLVQK